jgi:hypothetical protein
MYFKWHIKDGVQQIQINLPKKHRVIQAGEAIIRLVRILMVVGEIRQSKKNP